MANSTPSHPEQKRETNLLFRSLSHHRRRVALRILQEQRVLRISDLAERIARRENERPVDDLPSGEIAAVHADLYHRHVPLLAEAELIDYGEGRNAVAISDRANVETYLDAARHA